MTRTFISIIATDLDFHVYDVDNMDGFAALTAEDFDHGRAPECMELIGRCVVRLGALVDIAGTVMEQPLENLATLKLVKNKLKKGKGKPTKKQKRLRRLNREKREKQMCKLLVRLD